MMFGDFSPFLLVKSLCLLVKSLCLLVKSLCLLVESLSLLVKSPFLLVKSPLLLVKSHEISIFFATRCCSFPSPVRFADEVQKASALRAEAEALERQAKAKDSHWAEDIYSINNITVNIGYIYIILYNIFYYILYYIILYYILYIYYIIFIIFSI